jgi:hypothetical protein
MVEELMAALEPALVEILLDATTLGAVEKIAGNPASNLPRIPLNQCP